MMARQDLPEDRDCVCFPLLRIPALRTGSGMWKTLKKHVNE